MFIPRSRPPGVRAVQPKGHAPIVTYASLCQLLH
jgi:hypothetical protein